MLTPQQIAHRAYLQSATWKDKRKLVLERDHNTCRFCRNPGYDVHHKTYKHWGDEPLKDLITLCRRCHDQWHDTQKGNLKSKAIGTRAIWGYLTKSQKESLCRQFSVTEVVLYSNIYSHPRKDVCDVAARLMGYKRWYPQGKKQAQELKKLQRNKSLTAS
jgi:hypothetical protein